ncbi:NPCBM/NEW2 domain-containing protein [Agromyces sp. NPDC058104]|uniref:NPCBM/NEW2 domain-containing protein n=1 Tax=Agromyces sp. NPDC058104 TaxID=3346342 RepID=UPI0036D8D34D
MQTAGVLTRADPARKLTVDLTGVTWMRLHIDSNGANSWDRASWANPKLDCADA